MKKDLRKKCRNAKVAMELEERYAELIATSTFNNLNKSDEFEYNEAINMIAKFNPLAAEFLKIAIKQNQKFTICCSALDGVSYHLNYAHEHVSTEDWVTDKEFLDHLRSVQKEG